MDAAAKIVKELSDNVLPARPHTLTATPDFRLSAALQQDSRTPEEYRDVRMQYMTLISSMDRGIVHTRPYYDMREELPKKATGGSGSATTAVGSARSDKKTVKLSLSDWKKKKASPTMKSASLAESDTPKSASVSTGEESRSMSQAQSQSQSQSQSQITSQSQIQSQSQALSQSQHTIRPQRESKPPGDAKGESRDKERDQDRGRDRDRERERDRERDRVREKEKEREREREIGRDKERERDNSIAKEKGRVRERERDKERERERDKERERDAREKERDVRDKERERERTKDRIDSAKNNDPQRQRNGSLDGPRKLDDGRKRTAEPDDRPVKRIKSEDTDRVRTPRQDIKDTKDTKVDKIKTEKDRHDRLEKDRHERDRLERHEKDRHEKDRHDRDDKTTLLAARPAKDIKTERSPSAARLRGNSVNGHLSTKSALPTNKAKSSIPPLLSPLHIPPESKSDKDKKRKDDDRPKKTMQRSPAPLPPLLSPTLPPVVMAELERIKKTPKDLVRRDDENGRTMITFRIPRSMRRTPAVISLMGSDAEKRPSGDAAIMARKRPVESFTGDGEAKRPRTADSTTQPPRIIVPSTPSKAPAHPSRLTSSTPQPQTPADAVSMTPGDSSSISERPMTNGSNGRQRPAPATNINYVEVGRSLKHKRDDLFNAKGNPALIACISLECAVAYLYAFRKPHHHHLIEPLTLLLAQRMHDFSRYTVLRSLIWQLHALSLDTVMTAIAVARDESRQLQKLYSLEKSRNAAWRQAFVENMAVANLAETDASVRAMGVPTFGPWTRIEDGTREALRVLVAWAESEGVEWVPLIDVAEILG